MEQYENYKDSGIEYIGRIPKHWEVKRIKYIGFLYGGLSGKSSIHFNQISHSNNKTFIPFTNICNNKIIDPNQLQFVVIESGEKQNKVQQGDLFFMMSSENFDDVGKSSILLNDLKETYLNSFCKGFRITNDGYSPSFINYLLLSKPYRSIVLTEANGYTRINLKIDKINDIPIIFPTQIDEQVAIADFLDRKTAEIDKIIANKQKLIALYEEEKQAIINQAVTKGLDPNVNMKDSGVEWLGEIPEHWEVKKLKYIKAPIKNSFVDGPFGSNLKTEHFIQNGDVYVIDSGFITSGNFEFNRDLKTISLEHFETVSRSECNVSDIIIAKIGANFGMSGILPKLDKRSLVSGNTFKLTIDKALFNINFIHKQLLCLKWAGEIDLLVKGSAQPALSMGPMSDLCFAIPESIEEQILIVEHIENEFFRLDLIIEKFNKQIELMQEYKTTLISEVVTGKVKVN